MVTLTVIIIDRRNCFYGLGWSGRGKGTPTIIKFSSILKGPGRARWVRYESIIRTVCKPLSAFCRV